MTIKMDGILLCIILYKYVAILFKENVLDIFNVILENPYILPNLYNVSKHNETYVNRYIDI